MRKYKVFASLLNIFTPSKPFFAYQPALYTQALFYL